MLIEFRVGNFKSIKDTVTFSMVAANLTSKNKDMDANHVFTYKKPIDLLKSAALYGPNASGKSNFIESLAFMKKFVINSSRETQVTDEIDVDPFQLSSVTENKPSFFEMILAVDEMRYRYGFELDREIIHSEWLYRAKDRETLLFIRNIESIESKGSFSEGKGLETKTRPNALFLSVCAQWNGTVSTEILKWFKNLGIVSGLNDMGYRPYTVQRMENVDFREKVLTFIREFDFGISDLVVEHSAVTVDSFPKDMPEALQKHLLEKGGIVKTVRTSHKKFNENNECIGDVLFDLDLHESEGTQKAFAFSGPLIDVLTNGKILIVDELDARFHPMITQEIVRMFHDVHLNPKNAQLIFATHDTNLLDHNFFRRDQIWFLEKDRYGATALYSLVDFKVRNDASFGKDYISGRYGAVPFLGGIVRLGI